MLSNQGNIVLSLISSRVFIFSNLIEYNSNPFIIKYVRDTKKINSYYVCPNMLFDERFSLKLLINRFPKDLCISDNDEINNFYMHHHRQDY